jgi:DNA adenine methylase
MNGPCRPVLRWFGGKWRLAPWIIQHFPAHRIYVEPFGGAGSVLLRKSPSFTEVWNDLDDGVVNLFRVLRDPAAAARLVRLLELTPFSRREFEEAYEIIEDDRVERARRLVTLSFMGFGANAHARTSTGFRANSNRSNTTPAHDWAAYPAALVKVITRLAGVVIENRDAREVMAQQDAPTTLHYVDPPYVWSTRGRFDRQRCYTVEMTDDDHRALLAFLRELRGMVVISGYPHPIYEEALAGWRRVTKDTYADGAKPRIEALWLNPAADAALGGRLPLEGVA